MDTHKFEAALPVILYKVILIYVTAINISNKKNTLLLRKVAHYNKGTTAFYLCLIICYKDL